MNTPTDDDLLLDMIESVTLDVLARIGEDPDARYQFFKGFVALATEAAGGASTSQKRGPH
jgi:hypothetical protein